MHVGNASKVHTESLEDDVKLAVAKKGKAWKHSRGSLKEEKEVWLC